MVIYTPVCIYNHGEFFSNISPRNLIAEVLEDSFYVEGDIQFLFRQFFDLKYNIFSEKCFVVTSSLCGNVTTAPFVRFP